MTKQFFQRRSFLRTVSASALGLSAAEWLAARAASAGVTPKAKRCIVLFCWGGMSHIDTLDMKPFASSDIRSVFQPIRTNVGGIEICEHLPKLAARMDRVAVVRSVHHKASDHREAAYWNLTGHEPRRLGAPAIEPSREDWPSIGAMVAYAQRNTDRRGMPGAVSIPYPIADRGLLNGQFAGMLGNSFDPLLVRPSSGTPYAGVSPPTSALNLNLVEGLNNSRLSARHNLLAQLEGASNRLREAGVEPSLESASQYHEKAFSMIVNPKVRDAFDVSKEPPKLQEAYGDHLCGRSVLMARRLLDAGVPLATVYCCAGDLNGSAGSHWDTHGDGFNRLKRDMLPPLDQASSALLDDLSATGRLHDTLVVWLTEFGRTPKVNPGGGRDHFPGVYSVAFAGAGIRGGRVYGASDKIGSEPARGACGPEEVHATIFQAMGIDPKIAFNDLQGRPRFLCGADPLPLF